MQKILEGYSKQLSFDNFFYVIINMELSLSDGDDYGPKYKKYIKKN